MPKQRIQIAAPIAPSASMALFLDTLEDLGVIEINRKCTHGSEYAECKELECIVRFVMET